MAGIIASSSGDLTASFMTGHNAGSSEVTGEIGSWPALPSLCTADGGTDGSMTDFFFSAFLARRSVALVSLRKMMSNSSL